MTREQAIEHGKSQLEVFGGEHGDFIKLAIDTMRRYQKIEKIVEKHGFETSWLCLRKIKEVMEE